MIKETVSFLKKFGVKFAIDDYGTGSASSSMALNLPMDEIKIDMSFIRDIIENKKTKNWKSIYGRMVLPGFRDITIQSP